MRSAKSRDGYLRVSCRRTLPQNAVYIYGRHIEKRGSHMIIGIDFGSCYSSVAVMMSDNPVTSIVKSNSELGIPSIFLHFEGKLRYGDDCLLGDASLHRRDCIEQMKREVRANPDNIDKLYTSGGKDFLLSEIIRGYLKYILDKTVESARKDSSFDDDEEIEEVTITVPVGTENGHTSSSKYREILESTIISITGLDKEHVHIIEEPWAAAIAYLYKDGIHKVYSDRKKVIVFDLGGGSFDLTLAEFDPIMMSCRALAKDGVLELGGNDWDDALSRYVINKYNIKLKKDSDVSFRDNIIKLKTELSHREKYYIDWIDENDEDQTEEITRDEFEKCTEHLLRRTLDKFQEFVDTKAPSLHGIDNIVLVGGSSNMPQIKAGLSAMYSKLINPDRIVIYDPSKAIAKGAAIYSKIKADTDVGVAEYIEQVAPKTYGIKVRERETGKMMIENYIFKGENYPDEGSISRRRKLKIRVPHHDKTRIAFDVVESDFERPEKTISYFEANSIEQKCGIRMIAPVPEKYIGNPNEYYIIIEMELDENGILKVTAIDKDNNVCFVRETST